MNSDHENAKRHLNSFVILKKLSWALCAVAFVVSAVLFALGNSKADDLLRVACLGFILACIFSNAAGYQFNRLSIIDLQKQLSALEAGSPNEPESES
jgi:hypothetical protein